MKKNLFLAVFLLIAFLSDAQLNFGIKAGYTSSLGLNDIGSVTSGQYNLNSAKSELSNGFHAGAFARIGFKKVYFQPELLYSMGKKNYTIGFNDIANANALVTFDKSVSVSTVDIPLLLGYKLLDLKLANLRVFAGPKFRLNAGSSLSYSNLSGGGSITQDKLIQDIKASQVGLEAGVGIDVLMFTLDARYNLISDMYQTKISSLTIDNIPANTFVISLGWKIF